MIWDETPTTKITDASDDSESPSGGGVKSNKRRKMEVYEMTPKFLYRRAFSEVTMLDALGKFEFEEGHSYNFITGGDIDALTYLKAMVRAQRIDYVLFATWVIGAEDILQMREWLETGRIGKIDAYVGEIFPGSYKIEYGMLKELMSEFGGRLCVFRNHSKIFAGWGEKFHFAIQTSANISTNPRNEQGCISIDKGLCMFYKDFFDGIKPFNHDD